MENFSFDKIEYVRPDIDKAEEICKEYTAKLRAAKIATEAGVDMIIANGAKSGQLYDIVDGVPIGTRFIAGRNAI